MCGSSSTKYTKVERTIVYVCVVQEGREQEARLGATFGRGYELVDLGSAEIRAAFFLRSHSSLSHGGFESPRKADLGGQKAPKNPRFPGLTPGETPAKPRRNPSVTLAKARLKARFSGLKPE